MEGETESLPGAGALPATETLDIGARLRELRKARQWTLQTASDRTGVALSTLSKIERAELSPTISTLQRIAGGFGMDVATFVSATDVSARAAGRRSVTRARQGRKHPTGTCDNVWLCSDLAQKQMIPIRTRVRARSLNEYAEWAKHNAEIFLFVLSGRLTIHSQIYEPIVLGPGDSVYYDASAGHVWLSEGDQDADVLWVYTNY